MMKADLIAHLDSDAERNVIISDLANLSSNDYQERRGISAKKLGISPETLDEAIKACKSLTNEARKTEHINIEQGWHESVNGADILSLISETVQRHVILSPEAADGIALWCMHSHL